jgi:site-specific DNA-methyltransferase (adenine-specific)
MPDPYYSADGVTLHLGDCLDILPTLPDASIDAVVTDPPYGLAEHATATVVQAVAAWMAGDRTHVPNGKGFMGKAWDRFVPPPGVWDECLRVLKPGGHLIAFAGARTVDLMTLSIRIAGFEVRDSLHWIYGSGFPKSLDVSKAIDKAAGAQREVVGTKVYADGTAGHWGTSDKYAQDNHTKGLVAGTPKVLTAPATPDAARWQGWGTALKPAHEPIVLARKPLAGTVAANVLAWGTGALNIDATRIAGEPVRTTRNTALGVMNDDGWQPKSAVFESHPSGRWPTNVILTHPPLVDEHGDVVGDACADGCIPGCPVAEMDRQSDMTTSSSHRRSNRASIGGKGTYSGGSEVATAGHDDQGGASRFFPVFRYEPKAPARERPRLPDGTAHPTVKPLALMSWLVRLVTPVGGTVLEPFAGSGATLEAALREGFSVVGIERHEPYAELCRVRMSKPVAAALFGDVA